MAESITTRATGSFVAMFGMPGSGEDRSKPDSNDG